MQNPCSPAAGGRQWRGVKEEVQQRGGASLQALCTCLDRAAGSAAAGNLSTLAQDLALIGQQLHTLLCQALAADSTQGTAQQAEASRKSHQPQQQQQQQQLQQQPPLADVLQACGRFCQAVTSAFAGLRAPQAPQRQQHARWHHSQRQRPHAQQQQHTSPQQRLPAAAATALCSCLRQWADPLLLPQQRPHSSSSQGPPCDLPQAAVAALGALLPIQLDAISAHERAAVLALLLALVQPPSPCSGSSSTAGAAAGNSITGGGVSSTAQQGEGEQVLQEDAQQWRLACKAAVVLTDVLSEAARSAGAATAAAGTSKQPVVGASAMAGVRPEEAASIAAGLVEALSTACGVRTGGSSSRGCSTGGASGSGSSTGGATHPSSSRSSAAGAAGASTGLSNSNSSRQHVVEGVHESQYYAALLVALNHAVNSNKQGWQTHAGAITESARKLFTYGTRQQQQQQQRQPGRQADSSSVDAAAASAPSSALRPQPAAAAAPAATASQDPPPKKKYVPPHARAAAASQPQQQRQQESSDESEQSASDWSDWSDSEHITGSRRASSSSNGSSSKERSAPRQQQQLLHDPIKAVRVRSALLQLLQVLVQADAKALHPYWSALLPSQAPLQASPLSPHLLTMLLYDPSDKVRMLAAAVLGALLEGPAARALLAVAEAKSAQPPIRGFITMSVSLGHMLLSLHTGLLAVVAAWQQQQQQQQDSQQHQQGVAAVPGVLLSAVLRVLCALVPVTPYERLPASLLADVVDGVWQLWQQLQPSVRSQGAAAPTPAAASAGVPPLVLSHAPAAAGPAAAGLGSPGGARSCSSASTSSNSTLVSTVAVLAQAFSTKQPLPGLARWLQSSSSSSSRGVSLTQQLLAAATSPDCLVRIEALAALRGCCINYPAAVQQQQVACTCSLGAAACGTDGSHAASSTSSSDSRSASSSLPHPWQQLLAVVDLNLAAAAAQPPGSASTPRSSPRAGSSTSSSAPAAVSATAAGAGGDGSGSTSPEVKAGQHAVRLLGDWLAAEAAAGVASPASASAPLLQPAPAPPAAAPLGTSAGQPQGHPVAALASQWDAVLTLLLSQPVQQHPVIRSACAAVCGAVPAAVWLQLPPAQQQQLLAAAAATVAGADVTAVRAAACKLLGSCVLLPGVLPAQEHPQQQQAGEQQQQLLQLLRALSQCVSDEAVSVRLSAAWALANVCDEIRRRLAEAQQTGSTADADTPAQQQQQQQTQTHCTQLPAAAGDAAGGVVLCDPCVLRLLCDASVAAAGDTEKVRAHGVRAVGALLAAWQPAWGLDSDSSAAGAGSLAVSAATAAEGAAAVEAAVGAGWAWVPAWLRAAFGALQSCLAARSMKVVWNAACAAAAGLQNRQLLQVAWVAEGAAPGLLRLLVVLVRDSGNFKIKTHAAAALAAPADRAAYGEVYADSLLVVLAALQALQGSSGSSIVQAAAVEAPSPAAEDDEGPFPNFRYIPGLQAQLELSLVHLLGLLLPSDSTRLQEQLRRNQQLVLSAIAKVAATHAGQPAQQARAAAGGGAAGESGPAKTQVGAGRAPAPSTQQGGGWGCDGQGSVAVAGPAGAACTSSADSSRTQQLPADPFGQGARQSADGSAGSITTCDASTSSSSRKGSAKPNAASAPATGGVSPRKAGALQWGGAAAGAAPAAGKEALAGAGLIAAEAVAGVGEGDDRLPAVLGPLSSVLGRSVLDAWAKQLS